MIETLDDWNDKLEQCGCCFMPECPAPIVVCENNYATIDAANNGIDFTPGEDYDPLVDPLYYRRVIYHYEGPAIEGDGITGSLDFTETSELGGTFDTVTCSGGNVDIPSVTTISSGGGSFYYSSTFDVECEEGTVSITIYEDWIFSSNPNTYTVTEQYYVDNDFCNPDALVVDSGEGGDWLILIGSFFDYTETITYELPVTYSDFLAEIPNLITLATTADDECWYSPEFTCAASLEIETPGVLIRIKATALRVRFRIPDTHTGSYFKITYDIAEFPDDGAPSLVSEDNVIEWTGPGTGASSDPSWLTDWVVIEPPEVSGERRIVNVRYTCYSGAKYGAKPQLVGEAFP
jgi:hypothetical protein